MPLNLAQKQEIVAGLSQEAKGAISVLAADYTALSANQLAVLRKTARDKNVKVGVYRNTLATLALRDTPFECLVSALVGPIILFFAKEEPGVAARLVREFQKKNKELEVRALVLDGKLLGPEQLSAVADLPSREEALGLLVSVMQAPVSKFVRTLKEPVAQAVRAFGAVHDQKNAA